MSKRYTGSNITTEHQKRTIEMCCNCRFWHDGEFNGGYCTRKPKPQLRVPGSRIRDMNTCVKWKAKEDDNE